MLSAIEQSACPLALRIEWALKRKGISYEYIDEDLFDKSERLLMYNPVHKKIPVLLHGGNPIAESLVILEYIDETWTQNPILPDDPYQRAMARFWAKFGDDRIWTIYGKSFSKTGVELENMGNEAVENLKILDKLLDGKKFFGGECAGFLDIVFGWIAYWTPFYEEITGLNLIDKISMPNLEAWSKTFLEVSWVKEILPPPDKLRSHLQAFRKHVMAA